MLELIFWSALLIIVLVYLFYWVYGVFKGAPYYPSNKHFIAGVTQVASEKDTAVIAELGAGDGRVAFALAREGHTVDAYEINPFFALFMRLRKFIGRYDNVTVYRDDFMNHNLAKYDILITYLYPGIMKRLAKKFSTEAKPGAIVLSNTFSFKDREPDRKLVDGRLLEYRFAKSD